MGARKPPMMTGFLAEENLTGRAQKNVRKILDVIYIAVDNRKITILDRKGLETLIGVDGAK